MRVCEVPILPRSCPNPAPVLRQSHTDLSLIPCCSLVCIWAPSGPKGSDLRGRGGVSRSSVQPGACLMGSAQPGVAGSSLATPGALSAASGVKQGPPWHIVAMPPTRAWTLLLSCPGPQTSTAVLGVGRVMERKGGSCHSQGFGHLLSSSLSYNWVRSEGGVSRILINLFSDIFSSLDLVFFLCT